MAVTLFVGAQKATEITFLLPLPDKVLHFVYYGIMASLMAHAVGVRWLWVAPVLAIIVGVFDEWHQSMLVGRDASVWDWLADVAGSLSFVYAYHKAAMTRSIHWRCPRKPSRTKLRDC